MSYCKLELNYFLSFIFNYIINYYNCILFVVNTAKRQATGYNQISQFCYCYIPTRVLMLCFIYIRQNVIMLLKVAKDKRKYLWYKI